MDLFDLGAAFRRQERTLKSGRVSRRNYRVDFVAEDLFINTDARDLNQVHADRLKKIIEDQFASIVTPPSAATQKRREQYLRQPRSSVSYQRRYGGRTKSQALGARGTPNPHGPIFRDSQRLSRGMVVRMRTSSRGVSTATLNVPGNRLDPRFFGGGEPAIRLMFEELKLYVPLLGGRASKKDRAKLEQSLEHVLDLMLGRSRADFRRLKQELRSQRLSAIRLLGGFAA